MADGRRQHKRIPLTLSIAKPIRLEMHSDSFDGAIPGILVNLSAGGAALIVFHKLPLESVIEVNLDFVGVKKKMTGKIVREEKKFEDTYMIGIEFDKVSTELKKVVEDMAEDHDICEIRYIMRPEKVCFPDCNFRILCGKRIKKEF